MCDSILWEYLEELPEQEAAWLEWKYHLTDWNRFNTFYTHFLRVEDRRTKSLKCTEFCEHDCPRLVIENSPSIINAICPLEEADTIQLKFRDILIYSLRRESFHKAICASLQIDRPSGNIWAEFDDTWYLGGASKTYCPVYLTYQAATLPETINSLCRLHQEPFLLMVPTGHGLTPEAQQLLDKNSSVLFSMEAELTLQSDGSFKARRSISECMKSRSNGCPQVVHNRTLPIEAYIYLAYNEK